MINHYQKQRKNYLIYGLSGEKNQKLIGVF